ncbi:hypothetical protein ACP4OV_028981 [Aristida adscensionis]
MPPLAPHAEKVCSGGRQRQHDTAAAAAAEAAGWRRSASFHGRGAEQQLLSTTKQRPKTQPDLLAGVRGRSNLRSGSPDGGGEAAAGGVGRRTPSKVLVSVTVQRSMWPLHVMASAAWSVADLVAAAVALYVKEGRRPPLPSVDPAAFSLHYSQFSLESLNPSEKVMELGSRSFFLCPRSAATGQAAPSSFEAASGVVREGLGKAGDRQTPAWLGYMQFWPLM